jgi:hypothetical protein
MRVPFDEPKVTQAASRLLKLHGGTMNYMALIKLLYLIDREALLNWGRPVTTDRYVSMDRGPVLSNTLNLINEKGDPSSGSYWREHISAPQEYSVTLLQDPGDDELSPAEEKVIEKIYSEHKDKDQWELVCWVHQLPEWQDPEGSAIPISYRDILKAGKKTDIEIATILEELQNFSVVESFLSTSK